MADATFRFHAELNDFLPRERRGKVFGHAFERRAAIKDVIESLGVPHTEVDVILIDGASVGFEAILRDGDRVEVYPWSLAAPVESPRHLRPRPPAEPRFVLDAHLGRLARYLRLLGFDCRYRNDVTDGVLAACADEEQRILLTRDRPLLKRKRISLAHFVRADDPWRQVEEVCNTFDLHGAFAPFTRCTRCNGRLEPVDKAAVLERLEPLTRRYVERFLQCDSCGQVYWHGSHVARMQALVERLRQGRSSSTA
ncbi:Mut7-C ubiquitin/RNAse domain-containing protein [Halomonas sp. EGI 63088]|uniref:Mut7-C ubiquitin/RNAse domain-containing protein n=1 Tax=Halomonas flagellata TaxID=2920385 RepID=A0ABS9RZW2_9GAMM|nr:Mut7-C ubiquitin/RNAse domain-containing protein [Halomonas flagellata]MCH4565398.1 Mut7-C ubiquitin/RNAse domain-containing protein [Halomonas flagellata]